MTPSRRNWFINPVSGGLLYGRRRGAVSVLFAAATVPLIMLVGLAFDFGYTLQAKAQLDLAADAAAMAAARTAASAYVAGKGASAAKSLGESAGSQWFLAQSGQILNAQTNSIAGSYSVTPSGVNFSSTVSYTANVTEVLPNFFNWTAHGGASTISGTATAQIAVNKFVTVDFLADNTSSMMIAATDADAAKMITAAATYTPQSAVPGALGGYACTFACHWTSTLAPGTAFSNDYYGLSRKLGIQLRYDVVQSAMQTAISYLQTQDGAPNEFSVGVYAFVNPNFNGYNPDGSGCAPAGTYLGNPLKTIFPEALVDNGGAAAASAAVKTLVTNVSDHCPDTNFGLAFNALASVTSDSGTGNTSLDPQKSVIFISDGIEDDTHPQSIPTTEGPINPAVCDVMKKKGYTVYVLYTTYSAKPVNLPFNEGLIPYITGTASNDLIPALTACASGPNDIIVASSPADIQAGLNTLVNQAVGSATRLTN